MIALLVVAALIQTPNYPVKADSRAIFRPLDDVSSIGTSIGVACQGQMLPGNNQMQVEDQGSEQLSRRPKIADWD